MIGPLNFAKFFLKSSRSSSFFCFFENSMSFYTGKSCYIWRNNLLKVRWDTWEAVAKDGVGSVTVEDYEQDL
jgi:hypothetical protein